MTNYESSIINDDSPIPIPRQLARWIGWNEAGILQQIHYHLQKEHGQIIAGVRWIRMSETEWMEEIPLDEKAIQRAIENLVDDGLILAAVFKGRCKWYTVNYEEVEALTGPVDRIVQKSEKRKQARAARGDTKEQFVPIVINPIDTVDNSEYAKVKEQFVPIQPENTPKEQIVPICPKSDEWVQNVPLQESSYSSLEPTPEECKIRDRIGNLCRTNFFNPNKDPYQTELIQTVQKYGAEKVLWAIELALSPAKANGKPKTWGYVLGILEKDKAGTYKPEIPQNGRHPPIAERAKPKGIVVPIDEERLKQLQEGIV